MDEKDERILWVIMRVTKWASVTIAPFNFEIAKDGTPHKDSIGFLPVFESEEAALAACNDGDVIVPVKGNSNNATTR